MEHESEQRTTPQYKVLLYDWSKTIILSILFALVIRLTIVGAYYVPTGSMQPTIEIGDRLLGCKFLYWFTEPKAGDIVVFEPPPQAQADVSRFVKRVIAVEGDIVEVKNGMVYINGEPQQEPYASSPLYRIPAIKVPDGELFVLGDNRNNSADGHVWGFLPITNIEAKIIFRFWPVTRMGMLE